MTTDYGIRKAEAAPRAKPGRATAVFFALLLAATASHALWLDSYVEAYRVAPGAIKIDGKPDAIWKYIAVSQPPTNRISFFDYGKMVILSPDTARNDPDPSGYYIPPDGSGAVTLMAAYDTTALYFYFLVKELNSFDGRTACKDTANWWKPHAAEVFVDYTPWSETAYQSYFTSDAGGVAFGTSKKTIQLDKPVLPADTRKYYRDRTKNDRLQTRSPLPTGLEAVSAAHSVSDPLTFGVEMKIPLPAGTKLAPNGSLFISWGYNHYPENGKSDCSSNPIAYRWAKHFKPYADSARKPPGWKANDSTHYDPLRSWDGWGRMLLDSHTANAVNECTNVDDAQWDVSYWMSRCGGATGVLRAPKRPATLSPAAGIPRDARGRTAEERPGSVLFNLPVAP